MKVAMIANSAATHTQRWARAMAQRGHQVLVLSVRHQAIEGVDVVSMISPDTSDPSRVSIAMGYVRLRRRLPRELESFAPDVIHAHYASTNGYIVALVGAQPTILTVWGTDVIAKPGRALRRDHKHRIGKAIRHAKIVTSASEFMAERVREVATPERLDILPFGVDLERFVPFEPPGTATVLVVKALEARYGIDHTIDAMALVREQIPEARLTIAGGGSLEGQLRELAHSASVPVTFLGHVPHDRISETIGAADLLVNPTVVHESFGVIVLEAQAMGRPVVATRVGAVPTVCIEGETAILVEPHDPQAMANAIVSVLRKESLTGAFHAGPQFVSEHFPWARSVDAMEFLYNAVQQ